MDTAAFSEASAAWRENKIARKGGAFSYKCTYLHSNGKLCKKACVNVIQTLCSQHLRFGKATSTCLNVDADICFKDNGATVAAVTAVAATATAPTRWK